MSKLVELKEAESVPIIKNQKPKVKPEVRCIFCEKLEKQFRHHNPQEKINSDNNNINKSKGKEQENEAKSQNSLNSKKKEEKCPGRSLKNINKPKEAKQNDNQNEEEKNPLPVMLTNLDKSFDTFYKNFDSCCHAICYNCIARIIFTSHLNEIPSYEDIKIVCKCNKGSVSMTLNEIERISGKLQLPEEEKKCEKHDLVIFKFCLECKKSLCKKCVESHIDLFGENTHHLEDETPQYSDLCKDHPTCFLDTLCNDCHEIICNLCLMEGNKHYCHNAVSFNAMKSNIIRNVDNMKYKSFEQFQEEIEKYENSYEKLYNEAIQTLTDDLDKLIKKINECRDEFLKKMKIKLDQKNHTIRVLKNIYEFFFKDIALIPKSIDYPVLCLYQVFNSEFISFRIDIPQVKNDYITQITDTIGAIDNSDNFQNKYQFSLKNYFQSMSIVNHTDSINSICCLEDGRLVTGGEDRKVLIWSKTFDKIDLALMDNPKPIKLVKLLNDGKLIVGGYQNLKIYNTANNFKVSCVLKDISHNVTDLINLDDGRLICGSYREIKVYNMTWNSGYKDGKAINAHTSWVTSLLKLNGKRFASASEDKQIIIFDYNMKILKKIVCKFPISALCNQFNNDIIYDEENYNNFYIGDYDGRIHLLKFSSQNIVTVTELDQHSSRINSIIQLFGGNYCSIAQESKIIIHDNGFNPIQTINNNNKNKSVNSVIQTSDGKLITGNQLGGVNVYE